MTAFFYVLTVLIWSTTWIAIKLQLGTVAPQASIVYRFALAGCVMLAFLVLTRRLQRIPLKHQPFIVLQALCLFSCNFLCFYAATRPRAAFLSWDLKTRAATWPRSAASERSGPGRPTSTPWSTRSTFTRTIAARAWVAG